VKKQMQISVSFFSGLEGIQLPSISGRGDRFNDIYYITNDKSYIKNMVSGLQSYMGSIEWRYISELCGVIIHGSENLYLEVDRDLETEIEKMTIKYLYGIMAFSGRLWLVKDNAAYQDRIWVIVRNYGKILFVHNNNINVRDSKSDGSYGIEKFTRDEMKFARVATPKDVIGSWGNERPTALNSESSRFSRFDYYIQNARKTSDVALKVANYCSALESIVSSSGTEISHQVAERVSCLIEARGNSRIETYKNIKKSYDIRSKTIHGASFKEKNFNDIIRSSNNLDEICRKMSFMLLLNKENFMDIVRSSDQDFNDFFLKRVLG
jgi:hypothetical protein